MAYADAKAAPAGGNILTHIFSALGRGLVSLADSNRRAHEIDRLSRLSDSELARRGLHRQDIARYVFRDLGYL